MLTILPIVVGSGLKLFHILHFWSVIFGVGLLEEVAIGGFPQKQIVGFQIVMHFLFDGLGG